MSTTTEITLTAPPEVYRARRAALAKRLTRPLLICAGHAQPWNYPDNALPFRAGSTYLYYGGPPLENAAWLIEPNSDGLAGCTLLRPPAGPNDALWLGPMPTDESLAHAAGLHPASLQDPADLTQLLRGRSAGSIAPPTIGTRTWLQDLAIGPANDEELLAIINQRLIKDEHELHAMRRAADVSMAAHSAALAAARPGRRESDIAGVYRQVLTAAQCQPSFHPIVTVRGEILHNHHHPHPLNAGDLLIIDAGAEEPGGYACDITRTAPVAGRWSDTQLQIYSAVHAAMEAAVAACIPTTRYRDVHDLSARVLCCGLVDVGLLRGDPDELADQRRAHTLFYPHGVGHLVGLDVHDMEDFGDLAGYAPGRERRTAFGDLALRLDRDLAPNMTVTIEPGIYFVPAIWDRPDLVDPLSDVINRKLVDELLAQHFGGIRIEHTIRICEQGAPEVLTADLPTTPDELASLIGSA